jgi:uncharacterized protein (DUF2062 family)
MALRDLMQLSEHLVVLGFPSLFPFFGVHEIVAKAADFVLQLEVPSGQILA